MSMQANGTSTSFAGVFVQTNEQVANRVLAFRRDEDGALQPAGQFPTGVRAWVQGIWVLRDR